MKYLFLALLIIGTTLVSLATALDYGAVSGPFGVSCWYRPYNGECITYDTHTGKQVGAVWYPKEK